MSYELDFSLAELPVGLTLNAQLVDIAGDNVGEAVTTGFSEIGDGHYLWHASAIPDRHRGGVKIYQQGVPGTVLLFGAINPEEAERIDVAVSSRATRFSDFVPVPPFKQDGTRHVEFQGSGGR